MDEEGEVDDDDADKRRLNSHENGAVGTIDGRGGSSATAVGINFGKFWKRRN